MHAILVGYELTVWSHERERERRSKHRRGESDGVSVDEETDGLSREEKRQTEQLKGKKGRPSKHIGETDRV